jgi:GAF domain-containing protein
MNVVRRLVRTPLAGVVNMSSPRSTDPESHRIELATNFAAISRALYSAHTIQGTLQRIVALSLQTIHGCTGAGISFVQGDEILTPVWTEPLVLTVDNLQYATGEGPCLDAIAHGETFYADDLATDPRWPEFGPQAAAAGLRSLLSFCLFGTATVGALNLYATVPDAFDETDRAEGLIFAAHAGVALAAAGDLATVMQALTLEIDKLQNLQGALASRQVIGRAEGILMQREQITSDDAFDLLRRASQNLNTKLREVAQYVVETGEIPDQPA